MKSLSTYQIRIAIIAIAALLFVPFLNGVHLFDWDEINFAEAAREMIVTGDYLTVQINFQPFWEKPPLFIYMQVVAMKAFGINEFSARLPNAICGIVTLVTIFNIGSKTRDDLFGLLWTLAYAGSILPFLYFKSGIIDPWFNLFIFLGIYHLVVYTNIENGQKTKQAALGGIFAGLAVLTKGPVGFLLIALTGSVYLLSVRFKVKVKLSDLFLYFIVLALVGCFWFIIQVISGNTQTVLDFIDYQIRLFRTEDASHGGFLGYHFVVLLFGVFPSSILALRTFWTKEEEGSKLSHIRRWMIVLFWVVLVLFSIVKTKIVHYSSMAYFPLTFMAALFVYNLAQGKVEWRKWQTVLLLIFASLICLPFLIIPFVDKLKGQVIDSNIIKDPFAVGNLQANGNWTGLEVLIPLVFLIGIYLMPLMYKKSQTVGRGVYLWTLTGIFTYSVLIFIVPKIEAYSQRANIEFISSLSTEDVYIKTVGFKSYAPYFYGKTLPPEKLESYDTEWLLSGPIDKDAYFITKIQHANLEEKYPEVQRLSEKNGFVFYLRKKSKNM
jgi:4-amino-4-deoxy-L-arabinose transferase-like glycosyltransferase